MLYAKVGGYLTALSVDKGDTVKAGQALGEIEVPELLAERVKYEAEFKVAEIDFNRVREARNKAPDLVFRRPWMKRMAGWKLPRPTSSASIRSSATRSSPRRLRAS
jgi:multidrug efflux pump subunit AcrA (membrane-fusion protein)